MRKFLIIVLAAVLGLFPATSKLEAVMFGGIDFPAGAISFADAVFDYFPGTGAADSFIDPSKALNPPDGSVVSLGNGGSLVLRFTDNFLIPSGDSKIDLWVFELGEVYEGIHVDVSTNGIDWIEGDPTVAGPGVDIDVFPGVTGGERYSFVRLIDAGGMVSDSPHAGADIDAVGAISTLPVPEPASFILMGTGLAGLLACCRKD